MAYVGNFLALGQVHATLGVAQMIEQYSAPLSRKARPESVFVALEEVRNLAAAHARDGVRLADLLASRAPQPGRATSTSGRASETAPD